MTDSPAQPKRRMSPKAEEAFSDYVSLGPDRSYRALAAEYVKQKRYKTETTAFNVIARWAGENHWQDRLAGARTAESERKLQEAADLDADTYLRTSHEMNKRAEFADAFKLDELVRMRESVRKPAVKGDTNVTVNVSVEVQRVVDEIAERDGLTEDEKRELTARLSRRLAERH